jgi:hypothetical protein
LLAVVFAAVGRVTTTPYAGEFAPPLLFATVTVTVVVDPRASPVLGVALRVIVRFGSTTVTAGAFWLAKPEIWKASVSVLPRVTLVPTSPRTVSWM